MTKQEVTKSLKEVKSSNIAKLGWTTISKLSVLVVEYKSGGVYLYKDVSKEEYSNILNADSIGRYISKEVIPNHDYMNLEVA